MSYPGWAPDGSGLPITPLADISVNKGLPLYEAKVVKDPTALHREGQDTTNAASYAEESGSVAAERPTG
jgi:hypothetical protein